ncbi:unnamed protein product [Gongylonema pulchrum]|uniref:Uncharacterized protein n=1 Tax=Gongylonema pulchrum TaxID=637853 RepID=A0A183D0V3_9BILA|nr:unnamed protein product [Gongylonema pulchrum]
MKNLKKDGRGEGTEKEEVYSKLIASLWAEFVVAGFLVAYFYTSITGILALETNLDGKMLLPPKSQSVEGIRIMSDIVWPDYLSINYIIQRPPNFSNPEEYHSFAVSFVHFYY